MTDRYLIGKEYLENAITRAFIDGCNQNGRGIKLYVADTIDDMLRGDKPVNEGKVTMRDEFAMAALTGLLYNRKRPPSTKYYARLVYEYADAMIEERQP